MNNVESRGDLDQKGSGGGWRHVVGKQACGCDNLLSARFVSLTFAPGWVCLNNNRLLGLAKGTK